MSYFPSSGLFLKEECLFLFFDAFSDILIDPDTPRESHSTSDTGCKDAFVVPFPSRHSCDGKTEQLPHLPSLSLSPDCQQFFKFIVNPAGFYHVHPSQQHEGYPSGWRYYCNTTLTLLAPACQKTCNTQHDPGGHVFSPHSCCRALRSWSCFSLVGWLLLFPVLRRVWNLLQRHLLTVFALRHQTQPVSGCHAAWVPACLSTQPGMSVLMPISREGFSRSTSSIHFHQLYPDPPRDHGRSGAYSTYCNWWITPWRTIHTEGHFIVQVIYLTCKRFQRNQQHLLPPLCCWCKFQTIQGKQTHFSHIKQHYFDFKNTSSAQQREMRTEGAAKHHCLLDKNHCVNSVLDSEWDNNSC